jgi:hypothetical protein
MIAHVQFEWYQGVYQECVIFDGRQSILTKAQEQEALIKRQHDGISEIVDHSDPDGSTTMPPLEPCSKQPCSSIMPPACPNLCGGDKRCSNPGCPNPYACVARVVACGANSEDDGPSEQMPESLASWLGLSRAEAAEERLSLKRGSSSSSVLGRSDAV